MKVVVLKNQTTKTGFSLKIIEDDGTEKNFPINSIIENGRTLVLPKNPLNRQYLSVNKLADCEEYELTETGKGTNMGSQKSTKIYFTEEELAELPADISKIIKEAFEKVTQKRELKNLMAEKDRIEALLAQLTGKGAQ